MPTEVINKVALDVAAELGDDWVAQSGDDHNYRGWDAYCQRVSNPACRLHLDARWPPGRLVIIGLRGQDAGRFWNSQVKTEITVSQNKTPIQIANDITRRLLPAYERELAEATVRMTKAAEDQQRLTSLARQVAGVLGAAFRADETQGAGDRQASVRVASGTSGVSGSIDVLDGHSRIDLYVPTEHVLGIADSIATLTRVP